VAIWFIDNEPEKKSFESLCEARKSIAFSCHSVGVLTGFFVDGGNVEARCVVPSAKLDKVLPHLKLGKKRSAILLLPDEPFVSAANLVSVGSNPRGDEVSGFWLFFFHRTRLSQPPEAHLADGGGSGDIR